MRRLAFIVALLALCSAPSLAAAPRFIDVLFVDPADSSFMVAAQSFRKSVEKASKGTLKVRIHADGKWQGRSLDELAITQAVVVGAPQVGIVSVAPLAGFNPEMQVVDIPFLFRDYGHVDRVLDGPVGMRLLDGMAARGLRGLSFLDCGFRIFSSSKPLRKLADFRNLNVRVMQSRSYINLIKALQAKPVPSAVDKIHTMAARGYIDAADRSYPTYWDFHLYEVQKNILETWHAYHPKAFVINEAFFRGLSKTDQDILKRAAWEARTPQRQAFRGQVQRVKRDVAQRGVKIQTLSAADRQEFVEASRPVAAQVTRLVGEDLVRQVRDTR
jgi:tripartite ATP-independent transporter DctP family solute receptor